MLSVTEKFVYLADNRVKTVELREATLAVDAEAINLCAGLSEEQLSWSPRPGRWSIAQNLSHLRRTTEVFLPAVDATLEASRNQKLHSPGPFRLNLYGRLMVWRMESRPILKMRAPKAIRPRLLDSCCCRTGPFSDRASGPPAAHRRCRGLPPDGHPLSFPIGQLPPRQPAGVLFPMQCP